MLACQGGRACREAGLVSDGGGHHAKPGLTAGEEVRRWSPGTVAGTCRRLPWALHLGWIHDTCAITISESRRYVRNRVTTRQTRADALDLGVTCGAMSRLGNHVAYQGRLAAVEEFWTGHRLGMRMAETVRPGEIDIDALRRLDAILGIEKALWPVCTRERLEQEACQ
jgi:hypothetical protein